MMRLTPYQRVDVRRRRAELLLATVQDGMRSLLGHLESEKFAGAGNNYINTRDVANWLSAIADRASFAESLCLGCQLAQETGPDGICNDCREAIAYGKRVREAERTVSV